MLQGFQQIFLLEKFDIIIKTLEFNIFSSLVVVDSDCAKMK